MTAAELAEAIGDYCHTKYQGCTNIAERGTLNEIWSYGYSDEVVNMVHEFFGTEEGKRALDEFRKGAA